jgi:hypothetical protein
VGYVLCTYNSVERRKEDTHVLTSPGGRGEVKGTGTRHAREWSIEIQLKTFAMNLCLIHV